jgi:hypothetical protein
MQTTARLPQNKTGAPRFLGVVRQVEASPIFSDVYSPPGLTVWPSRTLTIEGRVLYPYSRYLVASSGGQHIAACIYTLRQSVRHYDRYLYNNSNLSRPAYVICRVAWFQQRANVIAHCMKHAIDSLVLLPHTSHML